MFNRYQATQRAVWAMAIIFDTPLDLVGIVAANDPPPLGEHRAQPPGTSSPIVVLHRNGLRGSAEATGCIPEVRGVTRDK